MICYELVSSMELLDAKEEEEEEEEEEKEEETKGEDLRHYEQQVVWPTKDVGDISDMLQIKGKDDVHMVYGVQEGDWLKLTREKQKLMNKKRKMKKKRKRPWRKSYISPRCGLHWQTFLLTLLSCVHYRG